MHSYDLIIVGGGPAGSAAALYAARQGLRCLLLDKATFPRPKTCGDALSGRSIVLLSELGLYPHVRRLESAQINRVVMSSPAGCKLTVDMRGHRLVDRISGGQRDLGGLVVRRELFDALLFRHARDQATSCHDAFVVRDVRRAGGVDLRARGTNCAPLEVHGTHADGSVEVFRGSMVLGCDGFSSTVARQAGLQVRQAAHQRVAIRQYVRNVAELTDQIELHFTAATTPGYFWIFPVGNGWANVGLGMDHVQMKRRHLNLRQLLRHTLESPRFRSRFAAAGPVGKPLGWSLPVASMRRRSYADGIMLLGDAAGLIDPFTGEGIGNAMYSARAAVETAVTALEAGDTRGHVLQQYEKRVWSELGAELKTSARLHRLCRCKSLIDWIMGRAERSAELRELICGMMADSPSRQQLTRPGFYLRLLFSWADAPS